MPVIRPPIDRFRSGQQLEPRDLNRLVAEIDALWKALGPGFVDRERMVVVRLPAGGIAARNASTDVWGQASGLAYRDDQDASGNPRSVLGSDPVTIYNAGNKAVGGGGVKDAWAYRRLDGKLVVISLYC